VCSSDLHIDLDVLDPSVARVNRYAAPGGVTAAALERVVRALIGIAPVRAVSLTAYEPELDPDGRVPPIANALLETIAGSAT